MPAAKHAGLLTLATAIVLDGAREAEDAAPPDDWKCDERRVMNNTPDAEGRWLSRFLVAHDGNVPIH